MAATNSILPKLYPSWGYAIQSNTLYTSIQRRQTYWTEVLLIVQGGEDTDSGDQSDSGGCTGIVAEDRDTSVYIDANNATEDRPRVLCDRYARRYKRGHDSKIDLEWKRH